MAGGLGFLLGGIAQGYEQASNNASMQNYRTQALQLQAKAEQDAQQRTQQANYMKIRSDAIAHLNDTMDALKVAHPELSPMQLAANPAVLAMKDQIGTLDKNLKLPNTIDSIVASLAEKPSAAVTADIARAQDPFKSQLEATTIAEKQANIKALQAGTDFETKLTSPAAANDTSTPQDPGEAFLAKLPQELRSQVKGLADYEISPTTFSDSDH